MPSSRLHFKLLFGVDDYSPERYGTPHKSNWRMLCPPPMSFMGHKDVSKLAEGDPDKWRIVYRQDLIDRCFTSDSPNLMDEGVTHPAIYSTLAKASAKRVHRKYGHQLFHLCSQENTNPDRPICANIAGFIIDEMQADSPLAYAILQSYEGGIPSDITTTICGWHNIPSTPAEFDNSQEARYMRLQAFNQNATPLDLGNPNTRFNQRIAIKKKLIDHDWNYTSFSPNAIEIWSIAARYIFQWLKVGIEASDMKMILYWDRI